MRKPSASTYPSVKRAPGTAVTVGSCICTTGCLLPLLVGRGELHPLIHLSEWDMAVDGSNKNATWQMRLDGQEPLAMGLFRKVLKAWIALCYQQVIRQGGQLLIAQEFFASIIGVGRWRQHFNDES